MWRSQSPAYTDAYVHHEDGCAACVTDLDGPFSPIWHALHSVRHEENFMDVFNALHSAIELRSQVITEAFEYGPVQSRPISGPSKAFHPIWGTMRSCLKSLSQSFAGQFGEASPHSGDHSGRFAIARKRSHVRFCEQVQLHVWDQHDSNATIEVSSMALADFLQSNLRLDYLQDPTQPMTLSRKQSRLAGSHYVEGGNLHSTQRGTELEPPLNFVDADLAADLPEFLHRLQFSLRERGLRLAQDEALRLRTWYVHHCVHDRCYVPRIVELEGDPLRWGDDIRRVWRDYVLHDFHLGFHMVHPATFQWTTDDAHQQPHADLILAQGDLDWRAGLLTIFPGRNIPSFELAASLPRLLSGHDLVRIGQAEFWLHNAHCRTTHGWQEVPFHERAHLSADGQSFVVAFIPTAAEFGEQQQFEELHDASSFMATVHQQLHTDVSPIAERPEVAAQEIEYVPEDDPSSSVDKYESDYSVAQEDEHLPWQSVAVFDTETHSIRGRVPFAPYEAFFRRVRALLGLRHHDVSRIIQITPQPEDLRALFITPLLILRHTDLEEGDFRRAALVDVEHHGSQWTTPVATDRYVIKLPEVILLQLPSMD